MQFRSKHFIDRDYYAIGDKARNESLVLHLPFGGVNNINVTMAFEKLEENESIDDCYDIPLITCVVTSECTPNQRIQAAFKDLLNNVIPEYSLLPQNLDREHWLSSTEPPRIKEGAIIPYEYLSQNLQSFSRTVREEHKDYASLSVRLLRWRYNVFGHHNPFEQVGKVFWSLDGISWQELPSPSEKYRLYFPPLLDINSEVSSELLRLNSENLKEPLGHELLREALSQTHNNPRSALVLGIAALEVGFKQLVSSLCPDTNWLIENVPTPPVEKMLKEYLPKLPACNRIKGQVLPPPENVMKKIVNGIRERNSIIHKGTKTISRNSLDEILRAVADTLWLFDYYNGVDWALHHLSKNTQEKLELEQD